MATVSLGGTVRHSLASLCCAVLCLLCCAVLCCAVLRCACPPAQRLGAALDDDEAEARGAVRQLGARWQHQAGAGHVVLTGVDVHLEAQLVVGQVAHLAGGEGKGRQGR